MTPTPIEMMIDAAVRCSRCDKSPAECRCYMICRCGEIRLRDDELCPAAVHDRRLSRYTIPQISCICELPEHSGRACADARNNKTPCRCNCHRLAKLRYSHRVSTPSEEGE